jgi:glycosyltransferase involved in cell wall biosynthesis
MNRFGAPTLPAEGTADVMLLLEGTYPFVSGGVSSWVHQIIQGVPELTFGIVFIGSAPDQYDRPRYTLPDNVVHLEEHYLTDRPKAGNVSSSRRGNAAFHRASRALHDAFESRGGSRLTSALDSVVEALMLAPSDHERDFLFSERAWEEICRRYQANAAQHSFVEYFWTVRSMHAPLFAMARVAARVPAARAFHVASTGYAGFLGALIRRARGRPLILTEHGIYTKERRIELLQAPWIPEDDGVSPDSSIGYIRQIWIRLFETLGTMAYAASQPIVSLYEGNRERQIRDGAASERTLVVPNGIDVGRFAPLRAGRPLCPPPVLGLVGRVVPIKDIKTFIRTIRVLATALPGVEGWVVGPDDEDKAYADECRHLARALAVESCVRFLGFQDVASVFPRMGLNVLTSISEAQPLVILEGFAAGVPCIAPDVGCCRELIEGVTAEDRALGHAGAVVGIADPEATARAALALLGDPERWLLAQRAAVARVERYYAQTTMLDRYRQIYRHALGASEA